MKMFLVVYYNFLTINYIKNIGFFFKQGRRERVPAAVNNSWDFSLFIEQDISDKK